MTHEELVELHLQRDGDDARTRRYLYHTTDRNGVAILAKNVDTLDDEEFELTEQMLIAIKRIHQKWCGARHEMSTVGKMSACIHNLVRAFCGGSVRLEIMQEPNMQTE